MHPVLFRCGPVTVYSYGLMVAAGFLAATFLASRAAARYQLSGEKMLNLSLVTLVAGIAGARSLYVLLNLPDFIADPREIVMIMHGGLVFYGGAITGGLAALWYARAAKMPPADTADLLAPYIPLAHAFGRIGCFLNGCCYGKITDTCFGLPGADGLRRFPVQICDALILGTLFLVLRFVQARRRFTGQVFFLYVIFYAASRFIIEFFRGDNPVLSLGLTFSQIVSAILLVIGIAVYYARSVWASKRFG